MKRYHITLGATTTAGGTVISASSLGTIDGMTMAVEGDQISCPSCRAIGRIVCDGPRLSETWNGKQAALAHDLCLCRCSPLPRMVANQTRRFQIVDGRGSEPSGEVAMNADGLSSSDLERVSLFDDRFRLVDERTGEPLINVEYAMVRASGEVEYGRTDAEGRTHVLSATVEAECIECFA
jgi:uncharacterized Zn-binding protein involved in type VI secretion